MQTNVLQTIEKNWSPISEHFSYPKNEKQYNEMLEVMEEFLALDYPDDHPNFILISLLGERIDQYEIENFSEVAELEKLSHELSSVDLLKHLMKKNGLKQNDMLDVFASQGYVSDILNGKRELNLKQIKALAKKFNVKAEYFIACS